MKKRKLTVNVLLALLLVSGCTTSKQFDAFLYGSSKPSLNTNTLNTASIETIAVPSGEEAATSTTKPTKTFKATGVDAVSSSTKPVTGSIAVTWTLVVDATTSATKPTAKTIATTGTTATTRTLATDTTTSATKPATKTTTVIGTPTAGATTVATRTLATDTTTSATKPATETTAVIGTSAIGAATASAGQTVELKEVEHEQESSKEPEEHEENDD